MEYHHKGSTAKNKFQNPSLGRKSWLQFFGTKMVLFTWTSLNMGPQSTHSHYNATLKTLKQQLRRVTKQFATTWQYQVSHLTHLLRGNWEAGSHHLTTPAIWSRLDTSAFHLFPKMKDDFHEHPCDSNNEVERTVRTWTEKQHVEFFLWRLWETCLPLA
jgi:hypothetical protein